MVNNITKEEKENSKYKILCECGNNTFRAYIIDVNDFETIIYCDIYCDKCGKEFEG